MIPASHGHAKSIAVDWANEHIYWSNDNRKSIELTTYNGSVHKTVLKNAIATPWSIVLDPFRGWVYVQRIKPNNRNNGYRVLFCSWMFWVETASNRDVCTVRSRLDGSHAEIVLEYKNNIVHTAICLDLESQRLYSIYNIPTYIFWTNYDGDHKNYITFETLGDIVFKKITVYDGILYLHDTHTLYKFNVKEDYKYSIVQNYTDSVSLQIYLNVIYIYIFFFERNYRIIL